MNVWRLNHGGTEDTERTCNSDSQAPAWESNAPQALPATQHLQPVAYKAEPLAKCVPKQEPGNDRFLLFTWCPSCLGGSLICSLVLFFSATLQAQSEKPSYQSRPLYQEIQQTLDKLARAEISQEETSLTPLEKQNFDAARQQCRQVIAQLKKINAQLSSLLTKTYQQRPSTIDSNSWTAQQLESLARNLQVQLARAYRNQALCYPPDSPDRINSLSSALEQLQAVINLPLDEPIVWQARIEQVTCLRHLKQLTQAQQQITHWQQSTPPTPFNSKLFCEQIRIHLAKGDIPQAIAIIESHKNTSNTAPETDDAILETLLAAGKPRQALQQLQHITSTHSTFWNQRAQLRLGQTFAELTDTDNPKILEYAAASLYHTGKLNEAVAAYDRLAKIYEQQDKADQQFQAYMTAATIVSKNNQPKAALDRYRQLALDQRTHTKAATAHWLAIGLSADLTRTSALEQRGKHFEHYLALLKEHLEKWPTAPTAQQAEEWHTRTELPEVDRLRAENLAASGQQQLAIAIYRKLTNKLPDDAELHEALAQLLSQAKTESEQQEALQIWNRIEKRSKPGGPRWLRARRARLGLLKELGEGERAKKLQQLTDILYPSKLRDSGSE